MLPVRLLDFIVGGVFVDGEDLVVILPLALLQPQLGLLMSHLDLYYQFSTITNP